VPSTLTPCQQIALVERLQAGDEQAEIEFVRLFANRLRTMIAARIHDRETARDLAQDALVASLSALRRGSVREGDKLAAFVYGVARNVANSFLRRRQGSAIEVPLEDADIPAPPIDFDDDVARRELAERALQALGASDQEVLTLTLVEGLTPREIAKRLGEGVDVIRTRKSRALKRVIAEVERLSRFRIVNH
jgi:RNA polymerase sigma factor (sigma-70 family)